MYTHVYMCIYNISSLKAYIYIYMGKLFVRNYILRFKEKIFKILVYIRYIHFETKTIALGCKTSLHT